MLQDSGLATLTHVSVDSLHESVVQARPSEQSRAGPAVQAPPALQVSPSVQ